MKAQNIVKHFGGISATARAFGVKKQSVYDWINAIEMPPLRQIQAQELTGGKFKAARNVYAIPGIRATASAQE